MSEVKDKYSQCGDYYKNNKNVFHLRKLTNECRKGNCDV